MASTKEDHWSSDAYQAAAAFVPKLATKVVEWLDVQPDDRILDVGCGDGHLTLPLAQSLTAATGTIHGIDSSSSMIASARALPSLPQNCTFSVADATSPLSTITASLPPSFISSRPTKIFSNAALHWILRSPSTRTTVFETFHGLLAPQGTLVFEMGGHGNVSEMHAALLMAVGRRIGIDRAREADPWFFPDEEWVRRVLMETGFVVEKCESVWRRTKAEEGEGIGVGVEGWVRLMGRKFLNAVPDDKEREECVREVVEALETVCKSPSSGSWIGYIRLRVLARKV